MLAVSVRGLAASVFREGEEEVLARMANSITPAAWSSPIHPEGCWIDSLLSKEQSAVLLVNKSKNRRFRNKDEEAEVPQEWQQRRWEEMRHPRPGRERKKFLGEWLTQLLWLQEVCEIRVVAHVHAWTIGSISVRGRNCVNFIWWHISGFSCAASRFTNTLLCQYFHHYPKWSLLSMHAQVTAHVCSFLPSFLTDWSLIRALRVITIYVSRPTQVVAV